MLGRFGRHSWDDNPGRTHFEDGLGWFIVLIRCNIYSAKKTCPVFREIMRVFYVGPMLGPCWVIWWAMWGSMEVSGTKNLTPTENFSVDVIFGGTWRAMSDQCWAVLGLCGGQCGAAWRSLE